MITEYRLCGSLKCYAAGIFLFICFKTGICSKTKIVPCRFNTGMHQQYILRSFVFNGQAVELFVPASTQQLLYQHTPYWGKVWPAAAGLCEFLSANLHLIRDKKVSELAAGLGLPSLFAARHAAFVHCSDIEPAAVELVQQSVLHNGFTHMQCAAASWDAYDREQVPDVLLLSDVNYEPEVFESLLKAVQFYLQQQCTVILSSPQRLMAKPFIEQLLVYCRQQDETMVTLDGATTAVSVFVLQS